MIGPVVGNARYMMSLQVWLTVFTLKRGAAAAEFAGTAGPR
jgi:hypothetical protein